MKITLKNLKKLIRESLSDYDENTVEGNEDELRDLISSFEPDYLSDKDYMDLNTGEIYLDKGSKAATSYLYPDYKMYRPQPLNNEDEDDEFYSKVQREYENSIKEFVENSSVYFKDNASDHNVINNISDMADSYFFLYHWKQWAEDLGITKEDIKSHIIGELHEEYSSMNETVQIPASYKKKENLKNDIQNIIQSKVIDGSITSQNDLDLFNQDILMVINTLKAIPFDIFKKISKK